MRERYLIRPEVNVYNPRYVFEHGDGDLLQLATFARSKQHHVFS